MDIIEIIPKPKPLPRHLSHVPVEADQFINLRVTRDFKEMVKSYAEREGCTVTRTVMRALQCYLLPIDLREPTSVTSI